MKKIVFALLFLFIFAGATKAQLRKVPADVTNALKAKYPSAENVEWKDKLTGFDAQFKDGDKNMTVTFNNKGEWQKTEKALTFEETPAAVKDGLSKSKYASPDEWKPGDVVTMITKSDKSVQYRVYVDKVGGIQKKYLFFNPSGRLEKEALTL
ncbi:MAG: PepSY-like domain-containing protein [Bacteroidota bacterium]|nr:PepSY-like domain-containing protein [Bacteroidota bacterium]